MKQPTCTPERVPPGRKAPAIEEAMKERLPDLCWQLVQLGLVEHDAPPDSETRAYLEFLWGIRFRSGADPGPADVGPVAAMGLALQTLPVAAPAYRGFLPNVLRELVRGCRCVPEAFRLAGVLPPKGSDESADVLKAIGLCTSEETAAGLEGLITIGGRRLDRMLDWWERLCRDALASKEARRVADLIVPTASRRQLLATGRRLLRRMPDLRRSGYGAREALLAGLGECVSRSPAPVPTWIRVERGGGLGISVERARDLLRGRSRRPRRPKEDPDGRPRLGRESLESEVQSAGGGSTFALDQAAIDREADPVHQVLRAREVRRVRDLIHAIERERRSLTVRPNAKAVHAVRVHLSALLLGSRTQAEVAEATGCSESSISKALAKEREAVAADPRWGWLRA